MDKIYLLIGNDTPLAVCLRKSEGEETPVPYDLSTAERLRLALVGHGMHVFAKDVEVSGDDNNVVSGMIPGRSLLKGDYDLEVTFTLDGRDKRFAVKDMFEAVDFLAEDADGEAEGEGAGIFVTVTVQPELIEISGPAGPQGKSAYQVWLDDGHTGTEDDFFEWLAAQTPNPDWNQNDSTEADFIKNRTHWEEESTTTIPDAKLAWSGSTPEDLDFWFHGTDVHIPRTSAGWGLTWQGGELFIDDNGFGYELGVYNGEEWSINPFDPSYDQQPYPLGVDVVITSGTTVHKLDNKFLDMDSTPELNSQKPVTSDGVKRAINAIPIPTVPTISTNIEADGASDAKTASPKAVKTFVEGKGYGTYSKPSGGIPASDLASGVIPTVPVISTDIEADKTSDTKTASAKAVYTEVSQLRSDVDDVKDFVGMSPTSKIYTLADMTKEVGYYNNANGVKNPTTNVWELYSIEIDNHNGGIVVATLGANTASYSAIALYNSTTMAAANLISNVATQSTANYTVSLDIPTSCKLIVICNRNGSNASPSAAVTLSIDNTNSLSGQINKVETIISGTDIELTQGGIDTSGRETVNANRVRTNIIEGAFEVAANSGYQVYYAYYYDKSGTFVRSAAVNSSSFVNNGGYNVRLAFAKSDATQPLTPEDNIIDTYKGGLQYTVEQSPIMSVCDSLSQIPSPADASLCFFRQRNGAWSDGEVWREIMGNNLLISGTAYRTCKVGDGSKVSGHNDETVLPLYSVTKLMTLVVVCDNVSDYSEQVTILADDIPSSTSDHYVQEGDVVTIDDLIAAAVIVSDNPAAQALARVVGHKINPSAADDNAARSAFYAAMNTKATALGMSDTTYGQAAWVGGNSTATDQCVLLREIYNNYPKITSYWGLLNHTMTITGNNARTYQITSTVNAADRQVIPEFVGGKTGTGSNLGNLAFVWLYDGVYYTSIVFQASPVNYRVKDAAQAIAEAKELN